MPDRSPSVRPAPPEPARPTGIVVEGHAIVSVEGMIAARDGSMPQALMNDADWRIFQAALDRAALVVLGRLGHVRHANPGRRRLVLTTSVAGLAADPADARAHLWNPAHATFYHVLERLGIDAGTVAVTGGTGVFDHFLGIGYDRFLLSRAPAAHIPEGRPCFSGGPPEAVLAGHGLAPVGTRLIDASAGVTLTTWRRAAVAAGRRQMP